MQVNCFILAIIIAIIGAEDYDPLSDEFIEEIKKKAITWKVCVFECMCSDILS